VAAVLIVSPTYFGAIADVKMAADISHEFGVPLIVDEAHGAHLKFGV
jgi:arginine decarboxylase